MTRARPQVVFSIEAALALAAVLLSTFLRVYRLDAIPPALYWDEAFDALDAWRLIQTSVHPIFFDGNYGREPLTIYLQALGMFLWGPHEWVARVVPALVGIATVPVLYRAGTLLFGGDARAQKVGLLAAGMLAVSFWHIQLSRTAIRVVSFPLLSTVAVYLFYRAWQDRRLLSFALSGVALGLTLYSYLAARLLPLVLIGFVFLTALLSLVHRTAAPRIERRRAWVGLGITLAVMLLVFSPLGIYFVQRPGDFFLRASLVSSLSGDSSGMAHLFRNAVATARMFIDRGDAAAYYNWPGRPALDVLAAVGFWLGLAIALVRFRARPVYVLLLVWLGVGLFPTITSDAPPHFLRASGALPPTLLLAADGLTWAWERLIPRVNFALVAMGVVAFGGVLTFNDYFNVWGTSQIVYKEFEVPERTVLERAAELSRSTDVILPFTAYSTPQAEFYLGPRFVTPEAYEGACNGCPAVWIGFSGAIERTVVVLQKDGRVLVPRPLDDQQVARLDQLRKSSQPITSPFGQTVASQLEIRDASAFLSKLVPARSLEANFGGHMRLWGYDIEPRRVSPGDRVRVTYYWQAPGDEVFDYAVQSVLLDANMRAFGRYFSLPHGAKAPTNFWRRGEIVLDSFEMQVPVSAHPGLYRFELKVVSSASTDTPLLISSSDDRLLLDPFSVVSSPANPSAMAHPLTVRIGNPPVATLLGYDVAPARAVRGEPLRATLYWRSEQATATDYSVFLHLLDAKGSMVTQQDGPPQNGNAPTSWWVPGDVIADTHELPIPSEISPGRYTLAIGVYDSTSGSRLAVSDAAGGQSPDNSWRLPVEIAAP